MGEYAIKPLVQVLAWIIASILVYLNVRLLISEAVGYFETSDSLLWKSVIIAGSVIIGLLLVYIIIYPRFKGRFLFPARTPRSLQ